MSNHEEKGFMDWVKENKIKVMIGFILLAIVYSFVTGDVPTYTVE